jgi:hypothetical protein
MEGRRLRSPNLKALERTFSYLRQNGGMELKPCLWIHPSYPEIVAVAPDGKMEPFLNRMTALIRMSELWREHVLPVGFHDDPSWPGRSRQ